MYDVHSIIESEDTEVLGGLRAINPKPDPIYTVSGKKVNRVKGQSLYTISETISVHLNVVLVLWILVIFLNY